MRNARLVPSMLIAATLVVASCGGVVTGPSATPVPRSPAPLTAAGDLVAGVTTRNTSPGADGVAVTGIVTGTNEFAIAAFRASVGEPTTNAVFGSYSVTMALLLTMAGTGGETNEAFARMLGVGDVDPTKLHDAVNAIDLILEGRAGDGLDLSTANKLFVQQGLELRDEFLDIAVGSYGAPVAAVDFGGAPDEAVDAVNAWVAEQTDGFIEQLTDGYDPETVVVLANAMYLKARWAVEFHRHPQPGTFTRLDGSTVEVEHMGHDEYLPLNQGTDFVAVELPYVGGNLSLVVVQPADLAAFEAGLTAERLRAITDGLAESGIHLSVPIWSTKTSLDLLGPLHSLGLPDAYDFDPMFAGGDDGFVIDKVDHVARIEVDETGTRAGAGTGVAIAGSHGPTITIDRPFFYAIRDRGSGAILFLGHVVDPTAA